MSTPRVRSRNAKHDIATFWCLLVCWP